MPQIIPIKELKNTSEISDLCHKTDEPIYVTKNGYGDMVIMSIEKYESTLKKLEMYQDIAISEYQIDIGETKDAKLAIREMRKKYAYNLIITKRAEELLDDLIYQLINRYKNEDAAKRLLNHIGCIHERLIDNPYQFPLIRD